MLGRAAFRRLDPALHVDAFASRKVEGNMTRKLGWMATGAMVWLAAASIAAQTSSTTTAGTKRSSAAANRVTVTGCLERADQISQTGTLGTTVDSLDFVLIKTAATDAKGTTGTAGATTTAGSSRNATLAGRLYRLDAKTATLNPHVGHKVELTGTIVEPGASRPDPNDPMPGSPNMRVDNLKMLAPTCAR